MSRFFAILSLVAWTATIVTIVLAVLYRRNPDTSAGDLFDTIRRNAVWLAFVVALVTTLGSLYLSEVAHAGQPPDHTFGLEDGEISVHAAGPLTRCPHDDLVDRERAPGLHEGLDQVTAGAGVAARAVGEARGDGLVQVGRHPGSLPCGNGDETRS